MDIDDCGRRKDEPTEEEVAAVIAALASRTARPVDEPGPDRGWAAYWRAQTSPSRTSP